MVIGIKYTMDTAPLLPEEVPDNECWVESKQTRATLAGYEGDYKRLAKEILEHHNAGRLKLRNSQLMGNVDATIYIYRRIGTSMDTETIWSKQIFPFVDDESTADMVDILTGADLGLPNMSVEDKAKKLRLSLRELANRTESGIGAEVESRAEAVALKVLEEHGLYEDEIGDPTYQYPEFIGSPGPPDRAKRSVEKVSYAELSGSEFET